MLLCARSTTGRVLFLRDDTLKKTLTYSNSIHFLTRSGCQAPLCTYLPTLPEPPQAQLTVRPSTCDCLASSITRSPSLAVSGRTNTSASHRTAAATFS